MIAGLETDIGWRGPRHGGRGRLRAFMLIGLLICAWGGTARAGEVETEARRATRLYEAGDYEGAAAAFARARELAQEKGEAPPTLEYNLGTALAKQGELDQAIETLESSVEKPDAKGPADLQERAYYNLGVSEARTAEKLRAQGDAQMQAEYETLQKALDAFRQSLILDPMNGNARHNYALTKRRIEEIESKMQQQQQDSGQPPPPHPPSDEQQEQQEQEGQQGQQGQQQESDSSGEGASKDPNAQSEPSPSEQGSDPESSEQQPPTLPEESGKDDASKEENKTEKDAGDEDGDSQPEQRGGLEASPTPTPAPSGTPSPGSGEQDETKSEPSAPSGGDKDSSSDDAAHDGQSGGGGKQEPELTPEQLDALRVLNALEKGSPEQFKRLFQFRGEKGSKLEHDW